MVTLSWRVDRLTSKQVICSVGNNTIYSPSPCGEGVSVRLLSRDRRPRLSATTFHLTLQATSPYADRRSRLSLHWGSHFNQREAFFKTKRRLSHIKETPFSNGEGRFFDSRILLASFHADIISSSNNTIHSPLHSERGWGWGSSSICYNLHILMEQWVFWHHHNRLLLCSL